MSGFRNGSSYLDELYIRWDEIGLESPNLSAGKAYAWGTTNSQGQQGTNNTTNNTTPTLVSTAQSFREITASEQTDTFTPDYSTFGINASGNLYAWGGNSTAYRLGTGDTTDKSSPVLIGASETWSKVSSTNESTMAINTDGTIWAWGDNGGVVGNGTASATLSVPTQIGTDSDWKDVSHSVKGSFGIKTDGTAWGWGGTGTDYPPTPALLDAPADTDVKRVVAVTPITTSFYGFVLKTDGTLYAIGDNGVGQLGLGDTATATTFEQVLGSWSEIYSGYYSSFGIKTDGTLWAWGDNSNGCLGLGNTTNRSSPTQVGALTNWKQVSVGDGFNTAIKTDGTLWMWGATPVGNYSSPVQVGSGSRWLKLGTRGSVHTLALEY